MLLLWSAILFAMNAARKATNEISDTGKITCSIVEMPQKEDTMRENCEEYALNVESVNRRTAKLFVRYVLLKRIKRELLRHIQKSVKQSTKGFAVNARHSQD